MEICNQSVHEFIEGGDTHRVLCYLYIIIAHDLAAVEYICDRIAVVCLGKIVEMASYKNLYTHAKHPYTQALHSAIPVPDPKNSKQRMIPKGDDVPSLINPPSGCHSHPRCPHRMDVCDKDEPVH